MKRVIAVALILALIAISLFAQESDEFEEIIVYITNTGTKYHRETCNSLRRSKIPITLEQAIERGYEPCRNCKPQGGNF
jgi:methylphosphotriester-DNA--protein-cysteine methyltransferase